MSASQPASSPARGTRAVLLGGIASGVGAYAFTILGARVLGEVEYAPVGVLWTLQYLVLTVGLLSLEALVTSERRLNRGAVPWVAGLVAALVLGSAAAGTRLFGTPSAVWPVAAGILGLGFGVFVLARGMAAAAEDFTMYGTMTGGESVVRLLIAVVVLMISPTAGALAMTLPSGALLMALLWFARRNRAVVVPPAGGTADPAARRLASGIFLARTTWANAVAQVLLSGGPLLTAAVAAPAAITSQVFVTTTAARAPLVLVYSGLLARLLTATGEMPRAVLRRKVTPAAAALGVTAVLAAAIGYVVGPPLVGLAFGQGLRPSATFAALTAAAIVLAGGVLTANQILIARRATPQLVLPWVAAMLVGGGVAFGADVAPDLRAGLATLAGLGVAAALLTPQILRVLKPVAVADVAAVGQDGNAV